MNLRTGLSKGLASATSRSRIFAAAFRNRQANNLFGRGWVDADGIY